MDHTLRRVIDTALKEKQFNNYRRRKRDTIKYQQRRWQHAVVPYVFDDSVGRFPFNYFCLKY